MSVLDSIRGERDETLAAGKKVPERDKKRIDRGRQAMLTKSSKRRMLFRFFRGDMYCWVDEKNILRFQPTVTHADGRGGKEPHRVRTQRNFIKRIVKGKVSSATNRTPGYDISPATTDPEDASAARLSQKVALYGYDKWSLRKARVKAVTNALVADGGYAMPYFDPNVGPFVEVDGRQVGQGEIRVWVGHGNQVGWEPGTDFDDSPWHAIFRPQPISEVRKWPRFDGGKLSADASTADVATDRPTDEMVLVTEYFERPCPDYPNGRKLTIANDRLITPPEDYPCRDAMGRVVDEPVIHQLTWMLDPDSDRDMGLVEDLVDAARVANDAYSKQSEWKNRTMNPQIMAPKGSIDRRHIPTDEPGRIIYFNPVGQFKPEWERVAPMPQELFQIAENAKRDMREMGSDLEIDAGSNVAARTVQAAVEKSQSEWAEFLANLAEFDSRLMRHCLYLVGRHYTEPRLLELRGRWGWESLRDFRGANMRGQTNVRVLPDSLVGKTREGIRQEIQFFVSQFPGSIPFEAAMAAWHGGLAENLIQGYELDAARAAEIVKSIQAGPEVLFGKEPQVQMRPNPNAGMPDPQTGQPQPAMVPTEVPWWMPGPSDRIPVWKAIIGDFLKIPEFQELEDGMKAAAYEVYNGLLELEMQEATRQAQMQNQLASSQGLANAAAPQTNGMPSQPALNGGEPPQ